MRDKLEEVISLFREINDILKETNLKMREINKEVLPDGSYYVIYVEDRDTYITCFDYEANLTRAEKFDTPVEAFARIDQLKETTIYKDTELKVKKINLKVQE